MSLRTVGRLIDRSGFCCTLLCCFVFGELCGREFAALDVACVDLRKLLPLLGQVIQRENRGHRADWHTGATVYALDGIDVELRDFIEDGTAIIVGRALLGVDAIYGAGIDAGGVLHPDAGLGNDVRHTPPPAFTLCLPEGRFKRCRGVNCSGYDNDGGEDFGGDVSGFEHEGFRSVLQRCFGGVVSSLARGHVSEVRAVSWYCLLLWRQDERADLPFR